MRDAQERLTILLEGARSIARAVAGSTAGLDVHDTDLRAAIRLAPEATTDTVGGAEGPFEVTRLTVDGLDLTFFDARVPDIAADEVPW